MTDEKAASDLARRYLDLWREQARLLADDQAMADMLTGFMTAMTEGRAGFAARTNAAAPARAEAAGGASSGQQPDVSELARRLAACEERIAVLEAAARPARNPARKGPRKRKPGTAD